MLGGLQEKVKDVPDITPSNSSTWRTSICAELHKICFDSYTTYLQQQSPLLNSEGALFQPEGC